jgi:hypothetical protein
VLISCIDQSGPSGYGYFLIPNSWFSTLPLCEMEVLRHLSGSRWGMVWVQVLTVASMKMAVFWAVAACSPIEVYRRFRGACRVHYQGDDDAGIKHLWKVCKTSTRLHGATYQKVVIFKMGTAEEFHGTYVNPGSEYIPTRTIITYNVSCSVHPTVCLSVGRHV